jgi:hypothetical protein
MKKLLKILGIVILVLLIVIISVPFLFKNQIKAKVEEEINKNVNAKVHFESLSLNLIRSFPDFYMSLNGLTVIGVNEFEKDTLVSFKSFSTSLDLLSVIKMDEIKIKSVIIDSPNIHAIVLKCGKANWDIAKPSADTVKQIDTVRKTDNAKSQPAVFKVKLKKFAILHANISYDDKKSGMSASLNDFNFELGGDLASDFTTINIITTTKAINFVMGGVPYLKNASNKIKIAVDADMKNMAFTLKENEFAINDIVLGWDGKVSMKDSMIITDMTFMTKRTDFKSLLSMVPAIYAKGFEGLTANGSLKLDGYVKGTYCGKQMPNAGLTLAVNDASFKYPSLPKSVENINIDLKVFWDGIQNDNSTVDLNKFHLEIAKNPIDIMFNLKTPISDPAVNGLFKGKIDLASFADVVPMDSTSIAGLIEMNLDFMGTMSMIQQQKFEQFKADGSVMLTGLKFSSPSLKQGVTIEKANLLFSPKFVELAKFDMVVGRTDIHLKGKLSNFIPYALKGETIQGNLDFMSNQIDLNEFTGGSTADTVQKVDTLQKAESLSTVEVPKNIDFILNSKINKLIFDKLEITNMVGIIKVKEGKLLLEKLFMNLLQGSMLMTAEYNTQDMTNPYATFNLDISEIDIPSAFKTFNTVQKVAPIAENAKGKVSVKLDAKTLMDAHMSPVLKSMNGSGMLASKEIEITNSKGLSKIADAVKYEKLKNLKANDVKFTFEIKDGRIYLHPFDTKILGNKVSISGDQGIDQTMNYVMKMTLPSNAVQNAASQLGGTAGKIIGAIGSTIDANINITGTFNDPKVGVGFTTAEGVSVKDKIKEQVKAAVEQKKAAVKAEVNKKAEEIMAKARKEADDVKAASKKAADIVRKESKDKADKMVKETSNPLAKAAAKTAAEKVKKEGEEKARKIENEGNQKADAIIQKAQTEADKTK